MTSSAPLAFDCMTRLTALLVIGSIRLLCLLDHFNNLIKGLLYGFVASLNV